MWFGNLRPAFLPLRFFSSRPSSRALMGHHYASSLCRNFISANDERTTSSILLLLVTTGRGRIAFQQTTRTARRHLQAANIGLHEHCTNRIKLLLLPTHKIRWDLTGYYWSCWTFTTVGGFCTLTSGRLYYSYS